MNAYDDVVAAGRQLLDRLETAFGEAASDGREDDAEFWAGMAFGFLETLQEEATRGA
jgi:hypothetical protein